MTTNAPMTTSAAIDRRAASGGAHFLRFVALLLASIFTYGGLFIGISYVLGWTGYRRRDVLMLFIPLVGAIVMICSVWRFTADEVYWKTRSDTPSRTVTALWTDRKLRKPGDLRDRGIVTAEEFETKKAAPLSRM